LLAAGLPVFMMTVLFGGISFTQVARIFAVTAAAALAAGSIGSTLALWREKTFQTLAITALALIFWFGVGEVFFAGVLGREILGVSSQTLGEGLSPLRGILAAARPVFRDVGELPWIGGGVGLSVIVSLLIAALLNSVAIVRVRVWNPSREARPRQEDEEGQGSIWGAEHDLAHADRAEQARAGHVDARLRQDNRRRKTREVWDNPVLWREAATWAYGRKVLIIRLAYALFFVITAIAVHNIVQAEAGAEALDETATRMPALAQPLTPFLLVSVVIVNALAVTAITGERDGRSLDLLLATDITPKEFLFGKLGGVLSVAGLMIALPLLLIGYLWWIGAVTPLEAFYLVGGMATLDLFVSMLGVHCGMTYADSRTAISVSLGAVFFLFLGVVTCILMMISFSGAFEVQLMPFLAFIIGGGVGLFVSLGVRNPSPAIALASALLPFVTFYAIVSFLLDKPLEVFLATVLVYGFATAAMMIPALGAFDIAMGRTFQAEE
jgi:ABC-type transport system involved in multi-copper enzyme maturation permease subunit